MWVLSPAYSRRERKQEVALDHRYEDDDSYRDMMIVMRMMIVMTRMNDSYRDMMPTRSSGRTSVDTFRHTHAGVYVMYGYMIQ